MCAYHPCFSSAAQGSPDGCSLPLRAPWALQEVPPCIKYCHTYGSLQKLVLLCIRALN